MTPVRIRGTVYRSITAAAAAQGVNPRTVYKHLDAGTPDSIGLARNPGPRSCVQDGIEYPSLAAAAAALGITRQSIHKRVTKTEGKR